MYNFDLPQYMEHNRPQDHRWYTMKSIHHNSTSWIITIAFPFSLIIKKNLFLLQPVLIFRTQMVQPHISLQPRFVKT